VTVIGYSDGFETDASPVRAPANAKELKTPTRPPQRHPSQGKLRVINQGSLSVSENIQTPAKLDRRLGFEDRETPGTPFRDARSNSQGLLTADLLLRTLH
jgi:hypothetical protein